MPVRTTFALQPSGFNIISGKPLRVSPLRSTIVSAHYGDDVHQQAFGELARRLH